LSVLALPITFSGLAKVAIFTTNVDAENQTLINHKCVCGALNRHFCQTRVTSCPSFGRGLSVRCVAVSVRLERHTLLQALARGLACVACKCV